MKTLLIRRLARLRAFHGNSRGVAAIEFAMIMPVMVLILAGLIDLTNLFSSNRKVTLTTNTIGDLVTQNANQITTAQLDGIFNAARPILDPIPDSQLEISITDYRKVGGSLQQIWQYNNGGVTCNDSGAPANISQLMDDGNDVIVTRGCVITHTIIGTVLAKKNYTLKEVVVLRPRQSEQLACTDCS
jgi:Flp pilus assembly protein TadG